LGVRLVRNYSETSKAARSVKIENAPREIAARFRVGSGVRPKHDERPAACEFRKVVYSAAQSDKDVADFVAKIKLTNSWTPRPWTNCKRGAGPRTVAALKKIELHQRVACACAYRASETGGSGNNPALFRRAKTDSRSDG